MKVKLREGDLSLLRAYVFWSSRTMEWPDGLYGESAQNYRKSFEIVLLQRIKEGKGNFTFSLFPSP